MKIINWKTSSDFSLIIDVLREGGEDIAIVVFKGTPIGWFHIQILRQIYPHGNFVFICRTVRVKKILKQSGYRVFNTLQEIDQILPEWYQIIQENLSVLDYIRFHTFRFISSIIFSTKKLKPRSDVFSVKHSSWYMLIISIVIVLLLMVGIVSLSSPHATIIITPQTSIQNAMRNVSFVLEKNMDDPLQIPVKKTVFSYDFKKTYNVNSYDPSSIRRSRGTIKIINSSPESLQIKPQTRVVIDTVVFRTQEWLNISPSVNGQPSQTTIAVVADSVGSDGVLIWKKWNIPENTPLVFPGLSEAMSSNLAVSALSDFSWGEDVFTNILTPEENARIEKLFRDQLIVNARESLLSQFSFWDEYISIPLPEAIKVLDMSIVSDREVGDQASQITFSGKGEFMIYTYLVEFVRELLLSVARSHLLEDTETLVDLAKSPPDIIEVLSTKDEPWSIKATTRIPVQILYDFSSSAGKKTIQNTLSDLLESDIERAEKTLLNHPYIKSVDIRLTPFWANKLPNSLEKISIRVNKVEY